MITIPSIRLLVCDLDGVIRHYDTDAQACVDQAYRLSPGTIARIAFSPRHLTTAISGRVSDDEWRSGIAGELAGMIDKSDALDAVAAWSADIGTVDSSVLDLLRQVRQHCPVIILSNATTRLRQDLSSLGLDGEVDAVVSSAETGSLKPQRAAFVATDADAERLLGDRPRPHEVLFVDDSPQHTALRRPVELRQLGFRRMRARAATRIVLVVLAAVVFGAVMSVFKGNGAGVRDGIGNLSAPWVIAPMLAGAAASRGRIVSGAVIGLLTTAAALVGFYLANSFVLDLGPHSTFHDLGLTLDIGNMWFKAGAVSGPAMGAAGAWASRRGRFTVAAIVIATIVLEPVAVYLAYLGSGGFFGAGDGQWNGIYAGECIVGLVAAVVLWRARGATS